MSYLNRLIKLQYIIMSWYMQSPTIQPRGIKVDGFTNNTRPHLNLSWGMERSQEAEIEYKENKTIAVSQPKVNEMYERGNVKVMTEASDQEQELMKLIKSRKIAEKDKEVQRYYENAIRSRSKSLEKRQANQSTLSQQKTPGLQQFSKRVRYLQNSLLPNCRQDNMNTVFDHNLTKEVTMEQSRMSKESNSFSKRPESQLILGNGHNAFLPVKEIQKDLTQKLKEMYDYQQRYKQRTQKNQLRLG